ncbi:MAG: hypothetical protein K6G26_02275, partial [Lachnospiraceae bacterium]|nr:hypothetical protein [Lachnospiraceae bacterium]
PNPILEYDDFEKVFLGYDYAYATGDNYSALYNEVPYIFSKFKLNNNGLFETEEEIREYIKEREKFINENPPLTLESGDFTVIRLYEVKL